MVSMACCSSVQPNARHGGEHPVSAALQDPTSSKASGKVSSWCLVEGIEASQSKCCALTPCS